MQLALAELPLDYRDTIVVMLMHMLASTELVCIGNGAMMTLEM